jgi:hypothetical protein
MPSKKEQDIQFGRMTEHEVLPILDQFFGEPHHKETLPNGEVNEYDRWDFWNESKTKKKELKGRRIKHDAYPTALLNASKIRNQLPSVDYTYIWKYTDGIYYLPYTKTLWDTFKVTSMSVWRDGRCETQPCLNVPHQHLIPLRTTA